VPIWQQSFEVCRVLWFTGICHRQIFVIVDELLALFVVCEDGEWIR